MVSHAHTPNDDLPGDTAARTLPAPIASARGRFAGTRAGPVRREIVWRAMRRYRQQTRRYGDHLRLLRERANVSQAAVARAIGVDRSVISRLESGDPSVGLATRFLAAELLGAEVSLAVYTVDAPRIYDRAHAQLVERLVRLAHRSWRVEPEAPVPGSPRRSIDVRLENSRDIVLFEVESKVGRVEELLREYRAKVDDVEAGAGGRRVHIVLVLPPTRHNRAVVAAARATLRQVFPADSASLLGALRSGGPWPGNGILWLGTGEPTRQDERPGGDPSEEPLPAPGDATNPSGRSRASADQRSPPRDG